MVDLSCVRKLRLQYHWSPCIHHWNTAHWLLHNNNLVGIAFVHYCLQHWHPIFEEDVEVVRVPQIENPTAAVLSPSQKLFSWLKQHWVDGACVVRLDLTGDSLMLNVPDSAHFAQAWFYYILRCRLTPIKWRHCTTIDEPLTQSFIFEKLRVPNELSFVRYLPELDRARRTR